MLGGFDINVVGGTAPGFHYIPCDCNGYTCEEECEGGSRFVGNQRDFELPLTGGIGATWFTMAGFAIIGVAILATVYITLGKGKSRRATGM